MLSKFFLGNNTNSFFFFAAMGMGLCVAFIAFVRLPSLKVSTLLLTGLLIYDVFWVSIRVILIWAINFFFTQVVP